MVGTARRIFAKGSPIGSPDMLCLFVCNVLEFVSFVSVTISGAFACRLKALCRLIFLKGPFRSRMFCFGAC